MAKNILQLNYDELTAIAKKFKDEGEDMVKLHSATRQRVRDLYKEWIGEAADKFFEEMENELLPALQRLATALFSSQDVARDIMKIVYEADQDTTVFFKDDFSRDDFGASGFQSALGGMGGPTGPDDFGAGKFDEALGGASGGGSSGQDDFGASQFEEALPGQGDQAAAGQGGPEQTGQSAQEQAATEPMTDGAGGAGGGSGSGSSGQGMQGDLRGMGVGSSQAQQGAAVGEVGRSGAMADHVYGGSGASSASSGAESQVPAEGGGPAGGGQSSSGGGQAAAAGAAGVAGAAAAGGAAKVIKDRKDKDD